MDLIMEIYNFIIIKRASNSITNNIKEILDTEIKHELFIEK